MPRWQIRVKLAKRRKLIINQMPKVVSLKTQLPNSLISTRLKPKPNWQWLPRSRLRRLRPNLPSPPARTPRRTLKVASKVKQQGQQAGKTMPNQAPQNPLLLQVTKTERTMKARKSSSLVAKVAAMVDLASLFKTQVLGQTKLVALSQMERTGRREKPSGDSYVFFFSVTRVKIRTPKKSQLEIRQTNQFLLAPIMTQKLVRQTVNKLTKKRRDKSQWSQATKTLKIGKLRAPRAG